MIDYKSEINLLGKQIIANYNAELARILSQLRIKLTAVYDILEGRQ